MVASIVLAVVVVSWVGLAVVPAPEAGTDPLWMGASDAPLLIAHQGGNREVPANTMAAFNHALAVGADVLEFDVVLTADERLAVIHDLTIDRTTDGTGPVADFTAEQLKSFDAGFGFEDGNGDPIRDAARNPFIGTGVTIPLLEEVFTAFPETPMLIELKDSGERGVRAASVLADAIESFDRAPRTIVASFHEGSLRAFRDVAPAVATSASQGEMVPFYVKHRLRWNALNNGVPFQALQLPTAFDVGPVTLDLTRRALRRDAARRGMPIHYWTINDRDEMERLTELGVAGIMTDLPTTLAEVLGR